MIARVLLAALADSLYAAGVWVGTAFLVIARVLLAVLADGLYAAGVWVGTAFTRF